MTYRTMSRSKRLACSPSMIATSPRSPRLCGTAWYLYQRMAKSTRRSACIRTAWRVCNTPYRTLWRAISAREWTVASATNSGLIGKADNLKKLHLLCDWVITLDRNAGIEYFDSPRDNRTIYDAYVIDCVPEREDLGCLQLITSTSNLDEVRILLDGALDQMGLSRSRRNAEFLLEHLKALSGRLAIRLTGDKPPTAELIALAVSQANCRQAQEADPCWVSLERGFIVPIDDVRDLLPPLTDGKGDEQEMRPDLMYVTTAARKGKGLTIRFVEVKYRRDLRAARSSDILRRHSGTDRCAAPALERLVFA